MIFKSERQQISNKIFPKKVRYGVYIAAFTFLGILLQFILHSVFEIWYIGLLLDDFSKHSFGFSWPEWFIIHHIGTVILLVAGALFGFWLARPSFWTSFSANSGRPR